MKCMMKRLANTLLLDVTRNQKQLYRTVSCNQHGDNSYNNGKTGRSPRHIFFGATGVASFFGYYIYDTWKHRAFAEENLAKTAGKNIEAGKFRSDLPIYSLEEVAKHKEKESKIWVTYKEGVYDITNFVQEHPGGEQILMAAGNSVDPFWVLYAVHESPHVWEILETLRIGNISEEDAGNATKDMEDPYANEPKRHGALVVRGDKPFNAETPSSLLAENFITPNDLFYVRNHLPVPQIDPETYELEVEVAGKPKIHTFTLSQLKKLPKHSVTVTVMCAGNRRNEMGNVKPVKGLSWGHAAAGNAVWTGARLRDVLKIAGVNLEDTGHYNHVQFEGHDLTVTGDPYGASIPIWKAVDKRCDVILAYEMNGVELPKDHGFPIRVVIPGVVGARNVKWLGKIVVSEKESDSHWQQNDYKGFSPSADWDNIDLSKSPAIQELPVNSAICVPTHGETVKVEDGHVTVKGYAWSGGGQKIIRVDVTVDCGKTWHVANIDHQDSASPPQHYSWTLWSARIPVPTNSKENKLDIWVKAVDSCYNSQPEGFANIWNLRGVLSNAYHKITVNLKK